MSRVEHVTRWACHMMQVIRWEYKLNRTSTPPNLPREYQNWVMISRREQFVCCDTHHCHIALTENSLIGVEYTCHIEWLTWTGAAVRVDHNLRSFCQTRSGYVITSRHWKAEILQMVWTRGLISIAETAPPPSWHGRVWGSFRWHLDIDPETHDAFWPWFFSKKW